MTFESLLTGHDKKYADPPTAEEFPEQEGTLYRLEEGVGIDSEVDCYVTIWKVVKKNPQSVWISQVNHFGGVDNSCRKIVYDNAKHKYAHYRIEDAVNAYYHRKTYHVWHALRRFERAMNQYNLTRHWKGYPEMTKEEYIDHYRERL